jgi:DNA-binding SARP family transcriptional activator/tetratricopeptide (TPR) repeat protein
MSDDAGGGASAEPVRFVLFGGARVIRGGVVVEVSQPKQQRLLALLMADPGRPVGLSEIVATLWSSDPAASVTNQIHRHIGALRRLCEPTLERRGTGRYIVPAGGGYRLAVSESTSDVLRFRRLVLDAQRRTEAGERRLALGAYVAALQMAAAPPGDDKLATLPAFVALEDERIGAMTAAIGVCDRGEDFSVMLPVIRAAAALHRLNETLHAALMLALTATGRAGEALDVYTKTRFTLSEELGAAPGADLRAAQAGALRATDAQNESNGEMSVARRLSARGPSASGPAQLPLPVPGFAGRHDLLTALLDRDDVDNSVGARPTILLVTGMAGVGKTTFAIRHAAELAGRYPDGQLYVNLRGFDATASPTAPSDALRDMLEGLGVPAQAQAQSVDARAALLRTTLSERRVLIVLDNARDYRQIEPLLPGARDCRVIITSRSQMPALSAFHQAETLQLDPFNDSEIVEFVRQRLAPHRGAEDTAAMVEIGRACGGIPLALAIVTARATANPDFPLGLLAREFAATRSPLSALNAGTADLDLSTVFSWSLRALSDDASRTFAGLSTHPGPEISLPAAVSMSGLDAADTRAVLTELTLANVLREPRPGRFVFHDLVRAYALGLLGERATDVTARLINHYVQSTRQAILTFGRPPLAPIDALPGVVAETFASSRAATAWYNTERHVLHQVCRLAEDFDDHRSAAMLVLDWRAMSQAVDSAWDTFPFAKLAAATAEHHGDQLPEPELRAEAYRNAATSHAHVGELDQARRYFDLAATTFEQSGDRAGLANLQRNIGMTLPLRHAERVEHLRAAVDIARTLDNAPILATSLQGLAVVQNWASEYDDALATSEEAVQVIAGIPGGLPGIDVLLMTNRVAALAGLGRLQEAAEVADQALPIARREGETGAERGLLMSCGDLFTALGRHQDAADAWRRLLSLISGPENARELLEPGDGTPGVVVIERISAKLVALDAIS